MGSIMASNDGEAESREQPLFTNTHSFTSQHNKCHLSPTCLLYFHICTALSQHRIRALLSPPIRYKSKITPLIRVAMWQCHSHTYTCRTTREQTGIPTRPNKQRLRARATNSSVLYMQAHATSQWRPTASRICIYAIRRPCSDRSSPCLWLASVLAKSACR